MTILGIDTSCDDTCLAILKIESESKNWWRPKILSNVVSSQVKLHAKYGGVYPFLAKREHQRNLPIVLAKALKKANFSISNFKFLISKINPNVKIQIPKVDLVAVTVGPGLEPCLWQGINFAKDLAKRLKKPLIPVNHIEAHLLANWLKPVRQNFQFSIFNFQILFPAICLIVSGGHTQLILMKEIGKYKILGETRDDAAGECFDKTARILGLGYPGGPAIAKLAEKNGREQFSTKLPRPMLSQKNYDFSFSGLKTAVLYHWQSQSPQVRKSKKYIQQMAAEIQQAVIDVLIHKTFQAAKDYKVKTIMLGGGVAANDELRKQFKSKVKTICLPTVLADRVSAPRQKSKVRFLVPPKNLCTDNGAMVAVTAFFHRKKATMDWQKIKADANLKI